MLNLNACMVRWDKEKYIPKKVYGFETDPYQGTPQQIAEKFLNENKDVLKISPVLNDLRYERTVSSLAASTVLFQQYFNNTPINAAWVAVHINKKNRVFLVKNDTVPVTRLQEKLSKRRITKVSPDEIDGIIKNLIEKYGVLDSDIKKESMIYATKGQVKEIWKVKFATKSPRASWILFVDKKTGELIEDRNLLWKAKGKGRVFNPNPVVTLDRDDLLDNADQDSAVLKAAYRSVTLKDLEQGGYLTGPYVDTGNTPDRVNSPTLNFRFTRQDLGFEEVMAYYHIDSLQRYIQSLGYRDDKGILNYPVKVNSHGMPDDQSWYDPSPDKKDITFGDGGVDDAEDAEIILHEYGHALQDAIIPGFGQNPETRALGEGYSDYLAASFFEKKKKGERKVKIAEWDAKGYEGGPQECLRRLDSTKHFPEDMEGEEHADGEIWSACLWKVRKALGRTKADTAIIESIFYLNQYADFREGADAIILAEKNLYGGRKKNSLIKIFRDAGVIS